MGADRTARAQDGGRSPPRIRMSRSGPGVRRTMSTEPMRILDRYVWKELGPAFFIGVGVFTFFLFIDRIYQLTNLVIAKNVPFHLVSSLLIFMLPAFFTVTLPVAILVAVLLCCGRLAGDLEVIALKAAGVSPLRLLRPFAVAGLVTSLLIACLTLVVNPWAAAAFQRQLFAILQTRAASSVQEHIFSAALGQIVLYVDELTPSQLRLKGILVSDERDPQRSRIIVAREGRLLSDERERRITLRFLDGSINETEIGEPRHFRYTAFTLYDMSLPMESPLATVGKDEKPELPAAARSAPEHGGGARERGARRSRRTTWSCTSGSPSRWPPSSSCSSAFPSASARIAAAARWRSPPASASSSPTTSCSPRSRGWR